MMLSRRSFIGAAAASMVAGATGAAYLTNLTAEAVRPPGRRHYPAIVVGSGYGGGVSALRLGQAGVETLILEKGRLWDTLDADGRRFTRIPPADTRAGWFSRLPPSLVSSYQGITVQAIADRTPSAQPVQAGICDKSIHCAQNVF